MYTGSTIADVSQPGVLEIQYRAGIYYGITKQDLCGLLTSDMALFRLTRPQVLTASPIVVPPTFCGITVENSGNGDGLSPIPGFAFGTWRMLAFGTYWAQIDTPTGYVWSKLDAAVAAARAAGKRIALNVAYTPTHRASDLEAHRSDGYNASAGWASAPADLAASLQVYPALNSASFSAFLRALLARYDGCPDFTFVLWNEANYRMWNSAIQPQAPIFNWKDTSDTGPTDLTTARTSCTGDVQRYTQLVRLAADLYSVVTNEGAPGALVLAPDFYGEAPSQNTGGKQDGITCFTQYLADGGGAYCHGFAMHGYMDEWEGIQGVSLRLKSQIDGYKAAAASAGYGAKPWFDVEFGHNGMGNLSLHDQRKWLRKHMWLKAAMGFQLSSLYVYDSANPATEIMSLYRRSLRSYSPLLDEYDNIARTLPGSTLASAMFLPTSGTIFATCNGVPYVDGEPLN